MADKITKMEGVRRALHELGKDAQPITIREYLMTTFGLDMTTAHISNYKTSIRRNKKGKKKQAVGRPKGKTAASDGAVAAVATSNGKATKSISLKDIQAVHDLVGRVGGSTLQNLIGMLGK